MHFMLDDATMAANPGRALEVQGYEDPQHNM